MPEVGHAQAVAPSVVNQHNVQLSTLPWSREVRRILGEGRSFRTPGQQSQKYAHIFHSRDQLLDTDACNMERRYGGPDIGIAFVGANHEGSSLGDRKIATRHASSRSQKSRTSVIANNLGQKVGVIVVWIGANRGREHAGNVLPRLVYGGEHDVAGLLAIQLLDPFTQVRFDNRHSPAFQKGRHLTLFLE